MKRNLIIGATAVAAIGGGTAGAIAATSGGKEAESGVLANAAKRLGVGTDELRSALSKAQDAQLDAEVRAGRLTQAQADALKQRRRQSGSVLGAGRGGLGHHGGRSFGHHGGRHFLLADAAKAIGISEAQLIEDLRAGKTLAAIVEANGKTLAEVKDAVKESATERLDADLKAGRITRAQRDEAVAHLEDVLDRLGEVRGGRFGHRGGFGHHGPGGRGGHFGP